MTIEIADRLIKLRKEHGYSQEELADKLGLSRQAVSKWERAEASPDTDNLICLAKLYGVSLDELLANEDDLETIVEEQVKKEEEEPKVEVEDEEPKEEKRNRDRVTFGDEGIHVVDNDGSEVFISNKGFKCVDKHGQVRHVGHPHMDRFTQVLGIVEGGLTILALVAYILMGTLANMWFNGWIVFFLPEIICSIFRAIHKRNPAQFTFPFLAVFVFFFVCMVYPGLDANLWHPMWVVFLGIPVYYITVSAIRKAIGKDDEDEEFKE